MNSMYRFECPINNENNKTIDRFSCLASNDETVDWKKGYLKVILVCFSCLRMMSLRYFLHSLGVLLHNVNICC